MNLHRTLLFFSLTALPLAILAVPAAQAATASPPEQAPSAATNDLDRYAGTYGFNRDRTLQIVREDDHLIAHPSGGQPPGTLDPQSTPGRFALREANFMFEFQCDDSGRITGLQMTGPDGRKQLLGRLVDARAAAAPLRALAADAGVSVNARVYHGYERVKRADGSFLPERYAFGNGGFQNTSPTNDPSIDHLSFAAIARSVAPALAAQGYIASADPEKTDLLVMVYWGSTASSDHPSVLAEEALDPTSHIFRNQLNQTNARVLGYREAVRTAALLEPAGISISRKADLIFELEQSRYWVTLIAFDFSTARKQKKLKALWSIRYNLPSRGTNFIAALPQMTEAASAYFGRDSKGLISRSTPAKAGKVELGETKVLGVEP